MSFSPHPRYLEPKKGPSQAAIDSMTPRRERFPSNSNFANVTPRYMEPKAPVPESIPKGIEECTFDVRKHREVVNARYSGLQPRYLNEKPHDPEQSPRRIVEKKIDEKKRERVLWRGDTVSGKYSTFDDLMRQTRKVEEHIPKPKPVTAPSRVAQYLLHGTASQPYSNGDSEARSRRQSPARGSSPMRSPRHWHSAGVDSSTFDRRQKETANRSWFAQQEKKVKELVERRNSIKVEPNHVPRVASLAIAEQVKKELERSHNESQLSADRSDARQAMYSLDGEENAAASQVNQPRAVTPILRFRQN